MKVFLYNHKTMIANWFMFPLDEEEIKSQLGEGYIEPIATEEFPERLAEKYCTIEELNRSYSYVKELPQWIVEDMELFMRYLDLSDILSFYQENKIKVYKGIYEMEEVAKEYGLKKNAEYFICKQGVVQIIDY